MVSIIPEHQFSKSYSLGDICKASVGSTAIKIENLFTKPCFTPIFEYKPPECWAVLSKGKSITLVPGQNWLATAEIKNEDGYVLENQALISGVGIHIKPDGTIGKGWIYLGGTLSESKGKWTDKKLFEKFKIFEKEGMFIGELIYTGLMGSIIRMTYKEYIEDIARPAFFQDLTYELTESKIIMFKTLRIKVLEATNSFLIFIVEDDGGLPWVPKK
jgi:hypothetical protein